LADALRPALELFQEAVGPEESRDLPGYWCAVATDRAQPLVSYAKGLEPRRGSPRSWQPRSTGGNFSALSAWGLAAALALGVTLGSLLNGLWSFDGFSVVPPRQRDTAVASPPTDNNKPRPTIAEHKMLAGLPAACFGHQPSPALRNTEGNHEVLRTADLSNLDCCTECHNANSDSVSSFATVSVSQSCQICHKERPARSLD
jgi:hypothetical protein